MSTKPLIVSTSAEFWHMAEETQVLYQILKNGYLTNKWLAVRPIIIELNYLLHCRGVTYDLPPDTTLYTMLQELAEAGLIGFYWDPTEGAHIRNKLGRFITPRMPNKWEIVNKLVASIGDEWQEFDYQYLCRVGAVLRGSGIDWDSSDQLLRFFAAFRRMKMIELQFHITGVIVARVAPKIMSLYNSQGKNQRSGKDRRVGAPSPPGGHTHIRINKDRRG